MQWAAARAVLCAQVALGAAPLALRGRSLASRRLGRAPRSSAASRAAALAGAEQVETSFEHGQTHGNGLYAARCEQRPRAELAKVPSPL